MSAHTGTAPPYEITPPILELIERIGEAIGRVNETAVQGDLRLRRINRVRTIQGSLAIEGNTLTEDEISTILDGKPVIAPLREVQEVRNAIAAYDQFEQWNPASKEDLLKAHRVLMLGLLDSPGYYRRSGVGVVGSDGEVHHIGRPANRVPMLITNLLSWLRDTNEHALIASSVFHYEFEFIHPFEDGNGRLGRLWQTLILTRWKRLFADVPVESLVYARQSDYYKAIRESSSQGASTPFIVYMLESIIDAVLSTPATPQESPYLTPQVARLLNLLDREMTARDILAVLGLKDRKSLRQRYLRPALEQGLVEMAFPDTPRARNQRYRRTARGRTAAR